MEHIMYNLFVANIPICDLIDLYFIFIFHEFNGYFYIFMGGNVEKKILRLFWQLITRFVNFDHALCNFYRPSFVLSKGDGVSQVKKCGY
ncbi:hypothetical protein L2E82_14015 [Cichorium intybus]|uniref:Uncharacterized protein n=1 Tax=Cichorium intybus TaxID=13427 RepID=A0ACB9EZF7_CICIN|nr:hypothetical protein L2E82_14015 [Cichorium intybus]